MEIVIPTWAVSLIVALVAILGAFAVQRFTAFRSTCAVFRAAFNTDIAEVANPARTPTIYVFLAKRFPAHDAAVQEFSAHLIWFRRNRLHKDWAAYGNSADDVRQRYSDEAGYTEGEKRRLLAVERLKKVVSHGKT